MNFSDGIQIFQWNCCGVKGKLPQIQVFANEFDIMCIQESLLWSSNFWINGFRVIRKDITASNQQGICILIRENLIFSTIDLTAFNHPSLEVLGIVLTCDNETIAIINIYRRPNHTPFVAFDQLFSAMLNNYSKIIFTGDFNAYHSWWGCEYEDSAGRILIHIIETHDLVNLNDKLPSIILHPNAKRSVIDLALASNRLASQCYSRTSTDAVGSDHFPIVTTIGGNFSSRNVFLYKLRISKKELTQLQLSLHNNFNSLNDTLSEDSLEAYQQLESHIKHHLYSFFPVASSQKSFLT